jgi:hypothetical protein
VSVVSIMLEVWDMGFAYKSGVSSCSSQSRLNYARSSAARAFNRGVVLRFWEFPRSTAGVDSAMYAGAITEAAPTATPPTDRQRLKLCLRT